MFSLQDYDIQQAIYSSDRTVVYRGMLAKNTKPVILKFLNLQYPSLADLAQYKQEYEITRSLNIEGVVKAYELRKHQNSLVILLEDFGGRSIKQLLSEKGFSLKEFLLIGISIAESLGEIHLANIIHKDINPSNIVYNSNTKQVKIIDFGISKVLSQEFPTICHPNQLQGTLAYVSPEQTGRMNRLIDYRTDLYSLGVSFYEMLTGQRPFQTTDAMELVHCHIAQNPVPPYILKGAENCPESLSKIVMKLMAKTAEDRYQNAWGLKADLEHCLSQLNSHGSISPFPLARQDFSNKFQISQKLYGRKSSVNQILGCFERVSHGTSEIVFVSGHSGIGKSVLVNEVHKTIIRQRSYFITGKFDQFKQSIPYEALIQAFRTLIRQLLTESDQKVQIWKQEILDALGSNAQLVVDVISELELIIGQQPTVQKLGLIESQNRFNLIFKKFIQTFATKEHPLVIFLDDLQWADSASLKFLELLTIDTEGQYLLIIGSYRDNEVADNHLLSLTLERIHQAEITVSTLTLKPLTVEQVGELVSDTLSSSMERAMPLAEMVYRKTYGNPFFLNQLLKSLHNDKLIFLDSDHLHGKALGKIWKWDLKKIQSVGITDNVIDLILRKINQLDISTQNVLSLAACIGGQFNLEILSAVNDKPLADTFNCLCLAIQSGLIMPLDDEFNNSLLWDDGELSLETSDSDLALKLPDLSSIEYSFLHDRVQQAAYALITDHNQRANHYKIGNLLAQKRQEQEIEENIFEIVNQLNLGAEFSTSYSERLQLSQFNLMAGEKAKLSAAYKLSLKYLRASLEKIEVDAWKNQYQLTLERYLKNIEAELLNAHFKKADELSTIALENARTSLDKLKVHEIEIQSLLSQYRFQEALDNAIPLLEEFGILNPQKKVRPSILVGNLRRQLTLKKISIEDLSKLPRMEEPCKIAILRLTLTVISALYALKPDLLPMVIFAMVKLCIKYGNSYLSPGVYVWAASYICGALGDVNSGMKFCQVSLELLETFNSQALKTKVQYLVPATVTHWKKHLKETVEPLQEAFYTGIETGDIEWASYASNNYCLHILFSGYDLQHVNDRYHNNLQIITKFQQSFSILYTKISREIIWSLMGENRSNDHDFDDPLDWKTTIETLHRNHDGDTLALCHLTQSIINYFLKDYSSAFENSLEGEKYESHSMGIVVIPQANFYSSLSILAYYYESNDVQDKTLLDIVLRNQRKMAGWLKHAPMNFQNKYDLVEAECAKVLGHNWKAEKLYDKAIQAAKKNGYLHEEALSYERAAEFYLILNRDEIGQIYLKNAYHCYSRWGAAQKVKQLEEEYPEYLVGVTAKRISTEISATVSTTTSSRETLDFATVVKATQVISGEIKLENLLRSLIKIVIENAGAQKGFLILHHNDQWVIEAQGSVNGNHITILESVPIDTVDPNSLVPILPTTIINYVARTQEHIVLDKAVHEGDFINDPYIISAQSKSVLCVPLLNQGQLKGIVYLENNLTTAAFTSNRVELLNILSAQAAISIDNSRLYQTLEQRVEERTQELSQTLEVLKATQAELIFENDLLRSAEQPSSFGYQVGGSLPMDASTYVVRSADRNLYKVLKQGEFCYILNARQMGKSSLMVRMLHYLQREGYSCAAIDMTRLGSETVTPEQWYKGFVVELWRSFDLISRVDLKPWWAERKDVSPVLRLSQFIEEFLLVEEKPAEPSQKKVILLDEIDNLLGLSFPVNDFFALIRSCYNQRSINPAYKNLTFALLGVVTPSDLISDRKRTPFNIGQAIPLEGFKEHEAQPLLNGLVEKVSNPQVLLKEILTWTGGQPFLTQKLCELVRSATEPIPTNNETAWVKNLVQERIIENWESQDEPEHLRTIRDRILNSEQPAHQLLNLYRKVLEQNATTGVIAEDSPAEKELLLSGLVSKQQGVLRVYNQIYQLVFNYQWVQIHLQV